MALGMNARIQVYHGNSPDTATCVTGDDNSPSPDGYACRQSDWDATQGESYLILLNSLWATGAYTFSVWQPQAWAMKTGLNHTKLPEAINKATLPRQKLSIPSGGTLVLSLGLVALFGFATLTTVVVRRRMDQSRSEAIPLQSAEECVVQ